MSNPHPETLILIDKITLNFKDPDLRQVSGVAKRLRQAAPSGFAGAEVRRSESYSAFVTIPLPLDEPSARNLLVLQAEPRDRKRSSYRIEFNPAKVGPRGVADIDLILTAALGIPAVKFCSQSKVTRLDLAVDIPGLTVNDVIVRSTRQRKHAIYSDSKGVPVTAYLGGARSNRTVTYDKPTMGPSSPTLLRIERRIHPKCTGLDLPQLADPFATIALIRTEPLRSLLTTVPADLFFDSARVRGIKRAIAMLPPSERKAITKVISEPGNSLVGNDIWKTWPSALNSSGLAEYLTGSSVEERDAAA